MARGASKAPEGMIWSGWDFSRISLEIFFPLQRIGGANTSFQLRGTSVSSVVPNMGRGTHRSSGYEIRACVRASRICVFGHPEYGVRASRIWAEVHSGSGYEARERVVGRCELRVVRYAAVVAGASSVQPFLLFAS